MKKELFKYWGIIGTLTEIEDYVRMYENDDWNCELVPFNADVYGLIKGRHSLPVNNYIFDDKDIAFGPSSFRTMEQNAELVILSKKESSNMIIYVTGYSASLIAAINAAKRAGYNEIVLKHHDKETGLYICQWVY